VIRRDAAFAILTAGLSAALVTSTTTASALPLYASRQGATCQTCHIDPNGGGIRNEFGFTFTRNRHAIDAEDRWSSMTVNPKLNDWITVGVDFRMLYVAGHVNGRTDILTTSTFFPMQGQVNLAVMPHEHLTLVASHGLVVDEPGFPTGYVAREIYGMIEGLPGETYAQAGRFRLPFGLRQDDHTSYTRDFNFLTYDSQEPSSGLEIGRIGAHTFVQAAVVNDARPFATTSQTIAAKIGWAGERFQAAVSGYHRQWSNNLWSVYASTTHGPWTLLGEYAGGTVHDYIEPNREAFFAELNYRVSRAVNVRGRMDYIDVFRGAPLGQGRRYAGEIDWNPVPFVQSKLSCRYYDEERVAVRKEYLAMLHVPF